MKKLKASPQFVALTALLSCAFAASTSAQISHGGEPASLRSPIADPAPVINIPAPDVAAYLAEDVAREHRPLRYGALIEADLTLADGQWTELADGSRIWRMQVASQGAYSLAFEFETFALPAGAEMFVYQEGSDSVFGAYIQENEHLGGGFVFEPYPGSEFTLEINVPSGAEDPVIRTSSVIYDYRDVYGLMDGTVTVSGPAAEGGSCLIDVNCPQGDGWDNQKRATMRTLSGGGLCSGALINNTDQDQTRYVLTADHCGQTSNTIFRFGYERPGCGSGTAPANMSVSGATVLASNSNFDNRLMRINANIPDNFNPYYAGWTRTTSNASFAFAMGHPSGGPKKISIDDNGSAMDSQFWRVFWQSGNGMLEGGSSGGPLFDQNGLIRGPACCVSNFTCGSQFSFFGRFDRFYTVANLAQWLDPSGTGVTSLEGLDPNGATPEIYCVGKLSSSICLAQLTTSNLNAQPVSGANDYQLIANGVQGLKNGLFFGSVSGQANIPFSGGTLCVNPPTFRTMIQNSGGSGPSSCDGQLSLTVNTGTIIPLGPDAGPGNMSWMQLWYRDPQNGAGSLGTALSDAVEFTFQ